MTLHRLSLLILLVFSWPLYGQSTSQPTTTYNRTAPVTDPFWHPSIIRDKKAINILNSTLKAMGGSEAIGGIRSLAIEANDRDVPSNIFLWQLSGSNYRVYIQGASGHYEINSGSGHSYRDSNGTVSSRADYISAATLIPAALAVELYGILTNPSYSVTYGSTTSIDGVSVSSITTALQTTRTLVNATSQTWYISTANNLPVKLDYRLFDETKWLRSVNASYMFSDFMPSQGVYFPHTITNSINSNMLATLVLTNVTINPNLSQSLFPLNEVPSK
jgi:hypothetical protein